MGKKRWLKIVVFAIGVLGILWAGSGKAELGPQVPKEKKLIGWACDTVTTVSLRRHIAEMESTFPLDGLVISVYPDKAPDKFKEGREGRNNQWMGNIRYNREDFKDAIKDLQATEFRRFTDNFIDVRFSTMGLPLMHDGPAVANVDWFDQAWSGIAENAAVAAYVAREAGFKGLFLDVESYSGGTGPWQQPFCYQMYRGLVEESGGTPRMIDECKVKIRQRGKEFMQAVAAVYPDITIVIIADTGWSQHIVASLVPSFVDGMLESSGNATLIDGGESSYGYISNRCFSQLRQTAEKKGPKNSQIPKLYKEKIKYAFGIWIDYRSDQRGWHNDPKDFEKNYRTPEWFEHTLYNALSTSDRYVWLFSWRFWNPWDYPSGQDRLAEAYLDAIRNCRKPHDPAWITEKVRQVENPVLQSSPFVVGPHPNDLVGMNILKNAGFETWRTSGDNGPDGWTLTMKDPRVSGEQTVVKEGSYSAKFTASSKGHVHLIQEVPIGSMAGKTVLFGVWVKGGLGETLVPQIVDFDGNVTEYSTIASWHEGTDGWVFYGATKTIRKDAREQIQFLLGVTVHSAKTVVYLDAARAVVIEK